MKKMPPTPKEKKKNKKGTILLNFFCGEQQGIYTPQNILLMGLLL